MDNVNVCRDNVVSFCKLVNHNDKNETLFHLTHIILNLTILIALFVFFEQLFNISKVETKNKCRNDTLHYNLNVIIAAFFILNIMVHLINLAILTFTNYYFGKLTKNCDLLVSKSEQLKVYHKKDFVYKWVSVIRIILLVIVVGLLIYGIYLWKQCGNNETDKNKNIYVWYSLFLQPKQFKSNSDNTEITVQYKPTDMYYNLKNSANNDEIDLEFSRGNWYFGDNIPYRYTIDSVHYNDKDVSITFKNRFNSVSDITLTFDYKTKKFILYKDGKTYTSV